MMGGLADERGLFDRLAGLAPDARIPHLEACTDAALRARVEALLVAHDRMATGFLATPAAVPADDPGRAGRRIGAYRVVREIGRGGMGAVYLATRDDDAFAKQVAIKVVAAPLGDQELLQRFRRERQILAGLEHPHIARLLDGGTTEDGLPYLVMEYVDGVRLDEYVRSTRPALADRLRLALTLCDAVQFAHRNLVVHRDLKPQNILVTADGSPKLLDFGIARLVSDEGGDAAGVTRTGLLAMTPEYASPEQLRGERVTTASDVYSLGVVLFEMLAGQRPFSVEGRRPDEVLRAVLEGETARASVVAARGDGAVPPAQLAGDLDAILATALRLDPVRRYPSVAALADDLGRHLDGRAVVARGEAWSYRAATFVRRHRAGVVAAAAVVAALVVGLAAAAWQAQVARDERHEAELQRARAERRFADVRKLANAFLFEFHDAIATLPGSTPARKLVVSKALEYLDGLAAEAGNDRALQEELAAAYDRVGDVQGNPTVANIGDNQGAADSYGKAQAIRMALAASAPGSLPSRLSLAQSDMKIGDALLGRGAILDAVARYKSAIVPREEALTTGVPSLATARLAVVETAGRLCTSLLATGDAPGALAQCDRSREVADALLAAEPGHAAALGLRAANGIGAGNVLRMIGRPVDAARAFADAIERHGPLLTQNPSNAELRRRVAVTYGFLATVQLELKQPDAAATSLARAIEQLSQLAAADPANVRSAPELAYFLNRRAQTLLAIGREADARSEAVRAIALLRAATEREGAGGDAFNEYAWALVSAVPVSVRDPAVALQYARRAVEKAGSPNPAYLHTLGWAQHLSGQRPEAIATLERALSLLAEATGPAVGLRRQIETDLATFRR